MKDIKIYIINLACAQDRKTSIIEQFGLLPEQLDYQFFTAINGNEDPNNPLFKKYNAKKREYRKGNGMTLS